MDLDVIEVLTIAGEGAGAQHWSRNATRPRYSLHKDEVKEANVTTRFTCFDVAERVEADHELLFAGRSNGTVVLWRMLPRNVFGGANKNDRMEEALDTSLPHKGAVTCLTHTPPGTYGSLGGPLLFSGSTDHTIKVWNAWAGPPFKEICLQTMAEHRGGVTALSFAGDATLISTSRDGSVRLWRPQRGRRLLRYPFFCCVKRLSVNSFVRGVASRQAGPGQSTASVDVWPTTAVVTGGEEWTLYCGDSDGTVSVFHRTSTFLGERVPATGTRSDSLTMEQLTDYEVALRRRWSHLHSLAITGLSLVPEHNFLLSIGNDGACRVLDYLKGSTFITIHVDGHHLFTSVAWDLAHEQLVIADASGVVQVWNTYTESLLLKEKVAEAVTATGPRKGCPSKALQGFHSSKTEGVLYGMSPAEGCFFRWKMVKTEGYVLLGQHESAILGLGFQGTAFAGRRPTAANTDHTLAAGDTRTAEHQSKTNATARETATTTDTLATAVMTLAREGTPLTQLDRERTPLTRSRGSDWGTNKGAVEEETGLFGLVLLSASMDGSVRAWETLGKSEKYCMLHPASEEVTTMLVLPGGSVLVTGTDGGSVRFWRLETGASEPFHAHDNTVSALAACRDRRGSLLLASADFEGTVIIWTAHAKDGLRKDRVPKVDFSLSRAHGAADGSDSEILCLAFVEVDTPILASAGNDCAVRCWSLRNHMCTLLSVLEGHNDSIEALLADGLFLLSGSCDGAVRVWNVSSLDFQESGLGESRADGDCGQQQTLAMGIFQAHPSGVGGMTTMKGSSSTTPAAAATVADTEVAPHEAGEGGGGGGVQEVGGLLVTCGKAEGVVKIWDYTHVEEDGSWGRLIGEIRSQDGELFTCVICVRRSSREEPLLFAGTNGGSILQLGVDVIDGGDDTATLDPSKTKKTALLL